MDGSLDIAASAAAQELGEEGAVMIFQAHRQGKIALTGRRIVNGVLCDRCQIPAEYFADPVRLYHSENEIGPDARVPFAEFERNLTLARWSDVKLVLVDFLRLKKAVAGQVYASNKSEAACLEWLSQDMAGTAPSARSKPDFLKLARSKFPHLSEKAFGRCWATAIARSGRDDLAKAGRKRKLAPL